jgi:hypothetical protein
MSKIVASIEVEQASYQLGEALGKTIKDVAVAIKAGGSVIGEGTAVLTALVADLAPVLSDFSQVPADLKDSPQDFMAAWMAAGFDAWKALTA